jgi:hypothetical protein
MVERRRHERIMAPALTVQLDESLYRTHDWSMGGFMIEGYRGRLNAGALVVLCQIAALDGTLVEVNVRARVVRADPERRRLMVAFLALDAAARTILRDHMAVRRRFLISRQPTP